MTRRQLRSVATTLHDDRDPVPFSTPVWYSVVIHCQSAWSKSYKDVQELSARQRRAGIRTWQTWVINLIVVCYLLMVNCDLWNASTGPVLLELWLSLWRQVLCNLQLQRHSATNGQPSSTHLWHGQRHRCLQWWWRFLWSKQLIIHLVRYSYFSQKDFASTYLL